MFQVTLTDDDYYTLENALSLAKEKYEEYATTNVDIAHLKEQFKRQAKEIDDLLDDIYQAYDRAQ